MTKRSAPWFLLPWEMFQLGIEAQSVVTLRVMKIAGGGRAGEKESARMVSEKVQAVIDLHWEMAHSFLAGEAHLAPGRALALVRGRVTANRRRLSSGG